jgi:hypothetical protein
MNANNSDPQLDRAESKPLLNHYWVTAGFGTIVIGVTLPILLVSWHRVNSASVGSVFAIEMVGCLIRGPGALILSAALFYYLRRWRRDLEIRSLTVHGMAWGVVCAFLNIPAHLSTMLVDWDETLAPVRYLMLFVVTGSTCGMWIAWQGYRADHPEVPSIPRYRLSTLLIITVAWGALLALYAPVSSAW